jgi:hypothetical protein
MRKKRINIDALSERGQEESYSDEMMTRIIRDPWEEPSLWLERVYYRDENGVQRERDILDDNKAVANFEAMLEMGYGVSYLIKIAKKFGASYRWIKAAMATVGEARENFTASEKKLVMCLQMEEMIRQCNQNKALTAAALLMKQEGLNKATSQLITIEVPYLGSQGIAEAEVHILRHINRAIEMNEQMKKNQSESIKRREAEKLQEAQEQEKHEPLPLN